jgi:hypothetical protein
MAIILDENILFQASHLRRSTSHSTPTQSTSSLFDKSTLLYDHPDSFTELLDHDDFDELEDPPIPSAQLDLTDDSDTSTHVKRPASQTGTERSSKKLRLSRQTKSVTAVDEAFEAHAQREHAILLAKIKLEDNRLDFEKERLVLEKEKAKQREKVKDERLAIEKARMEKQDERMDQILSLLISHLPKPQ